MSDYTIAAMAYMKECVVRLVFILLRTSKLCCFLKL